MTILLDKRLGCESFATRQTISSILKYPLDWTSVDGQSSRSRVLGIDSVSFERRATATHGKCDLNDLFKPEMAQIQSLYFRSSTSEYSVTDRTKLQTSIRTLLQLFSLGASLTGETTYDIHRLRIQCGQPEAVRV